MLIIIIMMIVIIITCVIIIIRYGQVSLVDKATDPKGTEFDPYLDHKRRLT
jgi:hypothetical protein